MHRLLAIEVERLSLIRLRNQPKTDGVLFELSVCIVLYEVSKGSPQGVATPYSTCNSFT